MRLTNRISLYCTTTTTTTTGEVPARVPPEAVADLWPLLPPRLGGADVHHAADADAATPAAAVPADDGAPTPGQQHQQHLRRQPALSAPDAVARHLQGEATAETAEAAERDVLLHASGPGTKKRVPAQVQEQRDPGRRGDGGFGHGPRGDTPVGARKVRGTEKGGEL